MKNSFQVVLLCLSQPLLFILRFHYIFVGNVTLVVDCYKQMVDTLKENL